MPNDVALSPLAGSGARSDASRVSLESLIVTAELERRASRTPDFEGESRALAALVEAMSSASANADGLMQQLAETALLLCRAHSACVSVLEELDGQEVFRWRAAAGTWERFLGHAVLARLPIVRGGHAERSDGSVGGARGAAG